MRRFAKARAWAWWLAAAVMATLSETLDLGTHAALRKQEELGYPKVSGVTELRFTYCGTQERHVKLKGFQRKKGEGYNLHCWDLDKKAWRNFDPNQITNLVVVR